MRNWSFCPSEKAYSPCSLEYHISQIIKIPHFSLFSSHFFHCVCVRDQNNRTALHEAARKGSKKTVEMIIKKRPHCVNYMDDDRVGNMSYNLAHVPQILSLESWILSHSLAKPSPITRKFYIFFLNKSSIYIFIEGYWKLFRWIQPYANTIYWYAIYILFLFKSKAKDELRMLCLIPYLVHFLRTQLFTWQSSMNTLTSSQYSWQTKTKKFFSIHRTWISWT